MEICVQYVFVNAMFVAMCSGEKSLRHPPNLITWGGLSEQERIQDLRKVGAQW